MSGIFGAALYGGEPLDAAWLAAMQESLAHRGPDARDVWCGTTAGLGQNALWTTPESMQERQPLFSPGRSLVLVADARIDNREELIAVLAPERRNDPDVTDADLILAAYQHWGEQCPERLLGDFAFAIWDEGRRRFFCARDHMGVRSLYYHRENGRFAFASEIKALFRLPWVAREIDEMRVAEHLVSVFEDQSRTFFKGICRLPAAHSLTVDAGSCRLRRYWALDSRRELNLGSDAEYEEAFRELLVDAVRCRLRSAFPLGSTLSGGLDSSSITCIARKLLNESGRAGLHTFSAVFPSLPKQYLRSIDERSYMRAVIDQGGVEAHEVFADRLNPIGDLDAMLWHQDDPLVPFNVYMHLGIYRAARAQGVRVVLDGLDGDTTVSHGFERLPELAKTLHWITLLGEVRRLRWKVHGGRLPLRRVLWTYAVAPLARPVSNPHWACRQGRRHMPWGGDSPIAESLAAQVGLDEHMSCVEREQPRGFVSARDEHRRSLESPLVPYALDLADKAAAACSIEARYPFFDRRLVEFCLALPADQKLREGHQRYILRRAMQGILPPEVQWRDSKGNLSSNFYLKLLSEGRDVLDRVMAEDLDAARGYIDPALLRETYSRYVAEPSNPDAMTLFLGVAFAAWIRQVRTPSACAAAASTI